MSNKRSNAPVCEVCQRGPNEGVSLFRQNEFGVKGIWCCREHRTAPVDSEVENIVTIIESSDQQAGGREKGQ